MTIGAVIVNYNLAAQSIDAALSLLGDAPDAKIVIVDNCSTDNSRSYLEAVLSKRLEHASESPQGKFPQPHYASLDQIQYCPDGRAPGHQDNIILLYADENGGFGTGCNIGLSFLQEHFSPEMMILLNPDAVLAKGSIDAWRATLSDRQIGLCGASIIRFEDTNIMQAYGGAQLNPMTLLGRNIGAGQPLSPLPSRASVEAQMSYPLGAAMALRADYYKKIGGFDERFFLYYEEADWARRGASKFRVGWARDAIVYHRHGAAAGSRLCHGGRSPASDYHMVRSRLRYALKWSPWAVPFLSVLAGVQALRRLLRGQRANAFAILRAGVGFSLKA